MYPSCLFIDVIYIYLEIQQKLPSQNHTMTQDMISYVSTCINLLFILIIYTGYEVTQTSIKFKCSSAISNAGRAVGRVILLYL